MIRKRMKKDVDLLSLFEQAQKCDEDVFLYSSEGDVLNLKSVLSRYVVATMLQNGWGRQEFCLEYAICDETWMRIFVEGAEDE